MQNRKTARKSMKLRKNKILNYSIMSQEQQTQHGGKRRRARKTKRRGSKKARSTARSEQKVTLTLVNPKP